MGNLLIRCIHFSASYHLASEVGVHSLSALNQWRENPMSASKGRLTEGVMSIFVHVMCLCSCKLYVLMTG